MPDNNQFNPIKGRRNVTHQTERVDPNTFRPKTDVSDLTAFFIGQNVSILRANGFTVKDKEITRLVNGAVIPVDKDGEQFVFTISLAKRLI